MDTGSNSFLGSIINPILFCLWFVLPIFFTLIISFRKIYNYNIRKHLQREKYNLLRIRDDCVLKRGMACDEAQL